MDGKHILQLATVTTRYSRLNTLTKTALNAAVESRFDLQQHFKDLITDSEKAILLKAEEVYAKILENTSQSDAVAYFEKIKI